MKTLANTTIWWVLLLVPVQSLAPAPPSVKLRVGRRRRGSISARIDCGGGTYLAAASALDASGFPEQDDPDLVGVRVDGFPIPATPTLANDAELEKEIRRVPLSPNHIPPTRRALTVSHPDNAEPRSLAPLKVIIAGGGLGGLALASTLIRNNGLDVHVYEQAKQYKPFGGPIQIQSNALWALREIHPALYAAVAQVAVTTGDRWSGIQDGKRYHEGWLVQFDAATPARRSGLPLTVAINRVVLQEIFLKYGVPPERIHTHQRVERYEHLPDHGVAVHLQDGSVVYGDILVGADGIWSRVRHQMYHLPAQEIGPKFATKHARYSGYTCFTGTCRHTPDDIAQVAYKVFLGQKQYFGCTDCGSGFQHWWAFLPDPPGAQQQQQQQQQEKGESMIARLKQEFAGWSHEIHDLLNATAPQVVKRRDLFDRPPLTKGWTDGSVALLGDAAHPTMPNLGQGGAMAIEDAYVLGKELEGIQHTDEIVGRLRAYERRRFWRASIAQFLSRNGSDLLVDWDRLRNTPIIGPMAMWCINRLQPISMNFLYSANI